MLYHVFLLVYAVSNDSLFYNLRALWFVVTCRLQCSNRNMNALCLFVSIWFFTTANTRALCDDVGLCLLGGSCSVCACVCLKEKNIEEKKREEKRREEKRSEAKEGERRQEDRERRRENEEGERERDLRQRAKTPIYFGHKRCNTHGQREIEKHHFRTHVGK